MAGHVSPRSRSSRRWLDPLVAALALVLLTMGGAGAAPMDGMSAATAGLSALQILNDGYSVGDGIYWLDPDGPGGGAPFQARADMTTDGGGWTLGLKTWYLAGHYGNPNAVGAAADALTLQGNPYKLSDASIRALIGASGNFDVLATQTGFNHFYSTGNHEYAVLRNYTGTWRWDQAMSASSTSTTLESHRRSDGAVLWSGQLAFGAGGAGINGSLLIGGPNPAGGAGCTAALGTASSSGWHHFYMADTNSDSYLYLCNGAQHSSGVAMNHLYWFRSQEDQTSMVSEPGVVTLIGTGLAALAWIGRGDRARRRPRCEPGRAASPAGASSSGS